jgi:hypothetical protein
MTEETYKYCDHKSYGVGAAQLIKYRHKPQDNLWMVTFQATGQQHKWFFCTKQFTAKEEIEFIDEARATVLYKEGRENPRKKRTKNVRKDPKNLADLLDSLF